MPHPNPRKTLTYILFQVTSFGYTFRASLSTRSSNRVESRAPNEKTRPVSRSARLSQRARRARISLAALVQSSYASGTGVGRRRRARANSAASATRRRRCAREPRSPTPRARPDPARRPTATYRPLRCCRWLLRRYPAPPRIPSSSRFITSS